MLLGVIAHVTYSPYFTMECSCKLIFFCSGLCRNVFLLAVNLSVSPDFRIEINIDFIFIKHRMSSAAFIQSLTDCRLFCSLCGSRICKVGAAMRHTRPDEGSLRRIVQGSSLYPIISLIFMARGSVFQPER